MRIGSNIQVVFKRGIDLLAVLHAKFEQVQDVLEMLGEKNFERHMVTSIKHPPTSHILSNTCLQHDQ